MVVFEARGIWLMVSAVQGNKKREVVSNIMYICIFLVNIVLSISKKKLKCFFCTFNCSTFPRVESF